MKNYESRKTYRKFYKLLNAARACKSWDDADRLLWSIEDDDQIPNYLYYQIKHEANKAAYVYMCNNAAAR